MWQPSDTIALGAVAVALISVVVSVLANGKTVQRALRDRHLSERVTAYADFLTTQDARWDAYDRARRVLKEIDEPDPDAPLVGECRTEIDARRVAAWAVQARLQLLAPESVTAAADAYADAITAANPMRTLPGRGAPYRGLGSDDKGRLKRGFVDAARADLAGG